MSGHFWSQACQKPKKYDQFFLSKQEGKKEERKKKDIRKGKEESCICIPKLSFWCLVREG